MPKRGVEEKEFNSRIIAGVTVLVFLLALFLLAFVKPPITGYDVIIVGDGNKVFCGNGVCSSSLGENLANCPLDCSGAAVREDKNTLGTPGVFSSLIGDWENGTMDAKIAKYFVFFLLFVFIFVIFQFALFPPWAIARLIFAVIIAFLALAYITPADLLGVMQTYSALGLALTTVLPFLVLMLLSAQVVSRTSRNTLGAMLLQRFLWLLFSLFLLYRAIVLIIEQGFGYSAIVLMITIVAFLIALAITFWNSKFLSTLFKMLRLSRVININKEALERTLNQEHKLLRDATNFGAPKI